MKLNYLFCIATLPQSIEVLDNLIETPFLQRKCSRLVQCNVQTDRHKAILKQEAVQKSLLFETTFNIYWRRADSGLC